MSAASRLRSVMGIREEHLHRSGVPLIAAGEERLLPAIEGGAVSEDRRDVDAPLPDQVEVDLHGMPPAALELLDAEGIRSDHGDLLEVERGPLEPPGHLDAGDHDRAPGGRDADADLHRLRI